MSLGKEALCEIASLASQLDYSRELHAQGKMGDEELNVVWDELSEALSSAGIDQQRSIPEKVATRWVENRSLSPEAALLKVREQYPATETGYPDAFFFAVFSNASLTKAWLDGLSGLQVSIQEGNHDDPENAWSDDDVRESLEHHLSQTLPDELQLEHAKVFFNTVR